MSDFDRDRHQAEQPGASRDGAGGDAGRLTRTLQLEAQRAAVLKVEVDHLRARLEIEQSRAAELADAAARLSAIEQSFWWRATSIARRAADRYPRLARRAKQLSKLVWWTARGTLIDHLREYRRRRAASSSSSSSPPPPPAPPSAAAPPQTADPNVALLETTGVVDELLETIDLSEWPADRPLVSIVIPCFNYGHLVAEAIDSAEQQSFSNIEIIAVEGGSTSSESRALLIEAVRHAGPRVRLIVQDSPHRAGANRNFGISHARGKYICCLDADDRLAPTYIEKALFMIEHAGYDVVSSGLRFFGAKSEVWMPHQRPTLDMLMEANQVVTTAVYSKAIWAKAGGYRDSDPATGHVHEDWLFWVRLAALGARFANLPEPLLHYRSHAGTLSNSESVLEHQAQTLQIQRFNSDVLTPEAIQQARHATGAPPRQASKAFSKLRLEGALSHRGGRAVLLAMPFLILGGAERLLSAIVAHLERRGWRVIIVTTVPIDLSHGDTTPWFEKSTSEIFHLPRFLEAEWWKDFVDHLVHSRAVDLLWVVGSAFLYDHLPALKLRRPGLRVVDLLFNTVGHTKNNRRYADCIDLIFVENIEVRDWLLQAGEPAERVRLVESGVDLVENAPGAPHERSSLGDLPEDAIVVGFFGRWSEEKDPLGFVDIAQRVSRQLNVVFVMTGAGPMEQDLKRAIAEAKFPPGRFQLKGTVPEVKP